ncbi:hypothetical protein B0H10DRAFT_2206307 [Mycena sp. CBHHK59/15]|nr:hypothetical protein B0H10DRAFT_2206307 [Mycena sp. CBHHK59/15]
MPATAAPLQKKPLKSQDKFTATILAEEETAQQALRLKQEKLKAYRELTLAKIQAEKDIQLTHAQAKSDRKRDKQAAKVDLMRLRMEQEHQLTAKCSTEELRISRRIALKPI